MNREIKYRQVNGNRTHYWGYIGDTFVTPMSSAEWRDVPSDQYTGKRDKNGVEIYGEELDFETALRNVIRELKAPKGQYNGFGKYSYRNAEDILEAVKPLLDEYKLWLTISDEVVMLGDRFYVEAIVRVNGYGKEFTTTAFARETETKKGMDKAQITGSASSYARKYALNGMFCIDDTKDADSMDNSKVEKKTVDKPRTQEQQQKIAALLALQGIQTQEMPSVLEKEYNVSPEVVMTFKQAEVILKDLQENKEPF